MEELSKMLSEAWKSLDKNLKSDKGTLKGAFNLKEGSLKGEVFPENSILKESYKNTAKEAFGKKPIHKDAKVSGPKEGAKHAAKEWDAKKGGMPKTDNVNDQGAEEAEEEFEGEKKAAGEDGVDREEGAKGGSKLSKDWVNHKHKKLQESKIEKIKNILKSK